MSEKEIYLDIIDVKDLEIGQEKVLFSKLELDYQNALIENLKLKVEILTLRLNDQSMNREKYKQNLVRVQDKQKKLVNSMSEKYKIEQENWGYDTDTGLIT